MITQAETRSVIHSCAMSLKVAVVGCGKIAEAHVLEIAKMPSLAQVVAVCDREMLMAEHLAVRTGVPRHYDSFERLVDSERPDVIHITTPPDSHLGLALAAIAAGCHVFVEKPLTPRHEDSLQLVAAAKDRGRLLTIGYTYLFDPPAIDMRHLLRQGAVGDVVHVESFFGYDLSGPFGTALLADGAHWVHRLPGRLLQNNIDHLLNKILEFFDDDAPDVVARGRVRRKVRFGDARDEMADELRVMLLGNKTTAYATFSAHIRPAAHFVRVYGSAGTLHVDYVARTVTAETPPSLPSAIGRLLPPFGRAWQYACEGGRNVLRFARSEFQFFGGLNHLISAFYQSALEGGPPPISYRDILRVSALMDEIFRQVPQGGGDK